MFSLSENTFLPCWTSSLFLRLPDFSLTSPSLVLQLVTDRRQSGRKFRGEKDEKGALYLLQSLVKVSPAESQEFQHN